MSKLLAIKAFMLCSHPLALAWKPIDGPYFSPYFSPRIDILDGTTVKDVNLQACLLDKVTVCVDRGGSEMTKIDFAFKGKGC